jgi:hypothetical protein
MTARADGRLPMHDDEADPEYEDDVRRDYGRLATIVVEEFPPSLEREALLERLAVVGGLSTH